MAIGGRAAASVLTAGLGIALIVVLLHDAHAGAGGLVVLESSGVRGLTSADHPCRCVLHRIYLVASATNVELCIAARVFALLLNCQG